LRRGALMAFDVSARKERKIADGVREFSATPDGALLALVRGQGRKAELWSIRRDGSALTQLTRNDRAESAPSWAADASALVFASAATDQPPAPDWPSWTQWCAASQVHLLNIADQSETSFGPGCAPAFSPDGRRIAYAKAPTAKEPDFPDPAPMTINSIRLINRLGQNGWDFAKAQGAAAPAPHTGRVVYAPAWSPDGKQLVYHRFLGYQALVDIDLSEIGGSLEGKGQPLNVGAGWLLPALFAPNGQSLAITENNYSDPRGFGGYDNWSVSVVRLEGTREIALPSGTLRAVGQRVDQLPRGQAAAWSPDGTTLAAELPPGWSPGMSPNEPIDADGQPGEIWRWRPGSQPEEQLVKDVDFASPLAWLP
jgi:WD40 repeat protein